MFTPDFRKPILALAAVVSAGLLCAAIVTGLTAVSVWAERDLHAFPFKDEDWLRYLLPTRFEAPQRDRIMLVGPSTVRENFRYDRFEAAFPNYDIYQGGISLGTIEDVTVALEYVEKVYGAGAVPEVIVLGIAPRFVANIPDERPFIPAITRYSPRLSAVQGPAGAALVPKGMLESVSARVRFLTSKQPARFRTGLLAVLNHWLSGANPFPGEQPALARALDWLLRNPVSARAIGTLGYAHVIEFDFTEILRWFISPYKYSLKRPLEFDLVTREEFVPNPDSWWSLVYDWSPRKTEAQVRAQLKRFADFVNRHGIRVLVVNLPERNVSRVLFDADNYRAYLDLVRDELAGLDFVNLREFLDDDAFYDREHTTTAGSIRLTDEIIRRLRATVLPPGGGG